MPFRESPRQTGRSALELLFAVAILVSLLALGLPGLRAYSSEAHILGAAEVFKQEFRKARSIATTSNRQTAIRFEVTADGSFVSVYQDGNNNGVLSADIQRGVDKRLAGPRLLTPGAPNLRIAILPGTPAPPPDSGLLDTRDPIRFGRSEMVSFTPLGGATPGTFYLAGDGVQAAIRVNGETGRIRLLIFRTGKWRER
jgi:type II secretory pathway pseudopilin PulG